MLAGTLFIIVFNSLGSVFIFSRNRRKKSDELEAEEAYKSNLLCRFVLDGAGRKVGESVAVNEDILIIKSGSKYLGIPLKHIEEAEKTLIVKGLVESDKAEMLGEKWRQEAFREIDYHKGEKNGF